MCHISFIVTDLLSAMLDSIDTIGAIGPGPCKMIQ